MNRSSFPRQPSWVDYRCPASPRVRDFQQKSQRRIGSEGTLREAANLRQHVVGVRGPLEGIGRVVAACNEGFDCPFECRTLVWVPRVVAAELAARTIEMEEVVRATPSARREGRRDIAGARGAGQKDLRAGRQPPHTPRLARDALLVCPRESGPGWSRAWFPEGKSRRK